MLAHNFLINIASHIKQIGQLDSVNSVSLAAKADVHWEIIYAKELILGRGVLTQFN
jgi:hypothetical protein